MWSAAFEVGRFNELGRAAWELQKAFKESGNTGLNWRFLSCVDAEQDWALADEMRAAENQMSEQIYSV